MLHLSHILTETLMWIGYINAVVTLPATIIKVHRAIRNISSHQLQKNKR